EGLVMDIANISRVEGGVMKGRGGGLLRVKVWFDDIWRFEHNLAMLKRRGNGMMMLNFEVRGKKRFWG
ncbi:hypothetical protein, partial [Bacillus sp. WP8]|uniref:hypothetical protein n=1 Tax=Bacillus sp. WP8 TaxID=756828 RepID=UPI001C930D76